MGFEMYNSRTVPRSARKGIEVISRIDTGETSIISLRGKMLAHATQQQGSGLNHREKSLTLT